MRRTLSEEKLEFVISLILIVGVIGSVAVETLGMLAYYNFNGNLDIILEPSYALRGNGFFRYTGALFIELFHGAWTPFLILSLGIILLMITPYVRVLASAVYFALIKNTKYFLITLFVLVVLTASLLVH
jgi:uncharacterized membrane protein